MTLTGYKMKRLTGFNAVIRSAAVIGAIAIIGLQPMTAAAQNVTPLDTTVVKQGNLTITLNATGSLSPVQEADLAFELSAPVTQIMVSEGQHVKAGDVLAHIESTNAESALRTAQISLAQAQVAYDNLTEPPRDVDVAVAQVTLAKASIYAASQTANPLHST